MSTHNECTHISTYSEGMCVFAQIVTVHIFNTLRDEFSLCDEFSVCMH